MIITSRKTVSLLLEEGINKNLLKAETRVRFIENSFLSKKIKFPLLEFLAEKIFEIIPPDERLKFLREITAGNTLGSFVIAGKMLQLQFEKKPKESVALAEEFIIAGDAWYVCDIIGERVFGHALLHDPGKTLNTLKKLSSHKNQWMVRVIGVAGHYGVKKGLSKNNAEELFQLLLSLSNAKEFHTKKGIGWAAKTAVKFYPEFASRYSSEIEKSSAWFKTKIRIGLGRSEKYAARYS